MKPYFEAVNNVFCSLCKKKKLWLIRINGNKRRQIVSIVCHECINNMGFELGKAMKPEGFSS